MYKITMEQKDYNRIVLEHLDREEAVGIMFGLIGHLRGSIKLEMDDETKEEAPAVGQQ